MKILEVALALLVAVAAVVTAHATEPTTATSMERAAKTVIVLVHGAFADGSSGSNVISLLEREGYTVIAVQNPLTSLADDVATTKRAADAQKEPVILVERSYGGAVIANAASNNAGATLSHVPFISQPKAVAERIERAAEAATK